MTKRTRIFFFVSLGVLVLGLGTGLVASYMGGLQNLVLIGTDGPDELAYVPGDAQMVAYADVRSVMDSQVRKTLHPNPDATTSQNEFQQRTGIDIEHDVDHVVASAVAPPPDAAGAKKQGQPVVLARGRFNTSQIETAMRDQGGTPEDYRGTRVVVHQGDPNIAVAFVEPGLVAFGPVDGVHRAIDIKLAGSGSVKDNANVMRLVKEVKNGDVWAVARFEALAGRAPLPPDIAGRLPAITWFSATGNIDDGIRGSVRAETRDDAAGQDLREVIRGFMALARLQAGNKAEFAALINSLQLSGQGKDVTLSFAVPVDTLNAFAAMHAQHPDAGAPGAPSRTTPQPRPHTGV